MTVTILRGGPSSFALSRQFSAADTLTSTVIGTTETAFGSQLVLPANYFTANKVLRVTALIERLHTATVPTTLLKLRLQSAGPTNVNLYAGSAAAAGPGGPVSNALCWVIQGTAAPGASVSVETGVLISNNATIGMGANQIAQGVLVATNVAQTLQLTWTFGASSAGNTATLRQFLVEEVG